MAYHNLPYVHKLSFILLKNLKFLHVGIALSYASNMKRKLLIFFLSKTTIWQLVALYLQLCLYDGNY